MPISRRTFVTAAILTPALASLGKAAPALAAPQASEAATAAALISRYRASYGLGPVRVDPQLNAAAEHQARTVAQAGSLSHGDFAGRMAAFGIRGKAAENLGIGVTTVEAAFAQWQGSGAHNANMLMPEFSRIGFARAGAPNWPYWALVLAR